jgi:hypothetical protein
MGAAKEVLPTMDENLDEKAQPTNEDHDKKVQLTMDGDGFHLERELSENETAKVVSAIMGNATDVGAPVPVDADPDSPNEDGFELTDDVMDSLSNGQRALIKVLLTDGDEDGWVTSTEIVPGMDYFERPIGRPGNIGGVRKGMTQKYGEDNDIIEKGKKRGETAYRLNPEYREEFNDYFPDDIWDYAPDE